MKVLGISGLGNAVAFKKRKFPDLKQRQYRLIQGADAAAALIIDGEIIAAAAEERFNGEKHSNAFPESAIRFCLAEGGLQISDIDEIAHCFDYAPYREHYAIDEYGAEYFDSVYDKHNLISMARRAFPEVTASQIVHVNHHLSHAAGAYWTSGWDECLIVVADGMGEVHGASVYRASGGDIKLVASQDGSQSFGIFYSILTYLLGFDFNSDEYKIMGLAPYGEGIRYKSFFDREVRLTENGFCEIPSLLLNRTPIERDNYLATLSYLSSQLISPREPESAILETHQDVAAALQDKCNEVMLHICRHHAALTGLRRLAIVGGVAQNCTAMGKIAQSGLFDEIYVGPAAGDDGAAVGAALYRSSLTGKNINFRRGMPFYGPRHDQGEVIEATEAFKSEITVEMFESEDATCADAAIQIAHGRVIAWYHGRMEFGARALGNRSIVADPAHPEMRDRVNKMVKKREAFRPFAPAVLSDHAEEWFELPDRSDFSYMTFIVNVKNEFRAKFPAITHVDGTARIQTVSLDSNPRFHRLISAVARETGVAMVLNTSFNVRGQPIIDTPAQAIATFLQTKLDCLYLERVKITRKLMPELGDIGALE